MEERDGVTSSDHVDHLPEDEQLGVNAPPLSTAGILMEGSNSGEQADMKISGTLDHLRNGDTSHQEVPGSQTRADNPSSQTIFRDLAENLGRFLQLQDETTRMRVRLQQLREAASRARRELEERKAQLQRVIPQQVHPKEYKSMTLKHKFAETRLQEAEREFKDMDFHLVSQESQVKTCGEELRQDLLKHSGIPITSPAEPSLPIVHAVSSHPEDTQSHHSTEFSFFSATGPANSSIYDPDAPGPWEAPTMEEKSMQQGSLNDYAPDLLDGTKWMPPELYVIPEAGIDVARTNEDEYLDQSVNDFLSEKMPLTTSRLGREFGKQRPGLHWVRWMLHMKELRQTVQDMLDSQPPELEVLRTAFIWQAEIRAYATELDPSTAGTGVPSRAPSDRVIWEYGRTFTGLVSRPGRPTR